MRLGTAVHTAILEPHRFQDEYITAPACDRRTKEGKAQYAAFLKSSAGKTIITSDQQEIIDRCVSGMNANRLANILMSEGQSEVTLLWDDERTGLPCKARVDWIPSGHALLVDLKTIRSVRRGIIDKESKSRGYHLQEAHYIDGALACGLGVINMLFCFLPTAGRPSVHWHYFDAETRRKARIVRRDLMDYAQTFWRLPKNDWPGYPAELEPQPISLRDYEI